MSASLRATYFLLTGLWLPRPELSHRIALEIIAAWDREKLANNSAAARAAILCIALPRTWLDERSYEFALQWAIGEAPNWWKLQPDEVIDTCWLKSKATQFLS